MLILVSSFFFSCVSTLDTSPSSVSIRRTVATQPTTQRAFLQYRIMAF